MQHKLRSLSSARPLLYQRPRYPSIWSHPDLWSRPFLADRQNDNRSRLGRGGDCRGPLRRGDFLTNGRAGRKLCVAALDNLSFSASSGIFPKGFHSLEWQSSNAFARPVYHNSFSRCASTLSRPARGCGAVIWRGPAYEPIFKCSCLAWNTPTCSFDHISHFISHHHHAQRSCSACLCTASSRIPTPLSQDDHLVMIIG